MDFSQFSALTFFGAIAIFIYGIRLTRAGVQLLTGDRLRTILASLTENRFLALGVGAVVTLILQSSSATTINLVGFVASGAMTLTQAMGVMLGADIGTTFVVMLLAVKGIATYSLLLLVAGLVVDILRRGKRGRYVSMILMGFGFVFFGMKLIIAVTGSLQEDPLLREIFAFLADRPWLTMVAGLAFTIAVQNSAAPIGLAIALAFSGLFTLETALPIVLGANVGACSGSILASLGSNAAGRRVALAHFLFKASGAVAAMLLLKPFAQSVTWFAAQLHGAFPVSGQIAIAHLLFNVYLVIVFLPLLKPAAWLIQKLLPDPRKAEEEKFRPRYLDPKSLETPSLAFANVRREMLRMLDLDLGMFRDCLAVFEKNDRVLLEAIQSEDDQVDLLNREIKFFLARLSLEQLSPEQGEMELRLIEMTGILEEIGDIINRSVLELAEKKIRTGRKFSEEGWAELKDFHARIVENFQIAAGSLATEDATLARKLLRHNEQLVRVEKEYQQAHLNRLHLGRKESLETSSIHLDLLANFYRINFLVAKLIRKAYPGILD
ncbi:Na/Pi cotransporter family protein [Deltaproteobacteria bacterium PRO3]|nr:Na/Pi cotransporter family protein [Deltaproteobacteria bacterium PRO3]